MRRDFCHAQLVPPDSRRTRYTHAVPHTGVPLRPKPGNPCVRGSTPCKPPSFRSRWQIHNHNLIVARQNTAFTCVFSLSGITFSKSSHSFSENGVSPPSAAGPHARGLRARGFRSRWRARRSGRAGGFRGRWGAGSLRGRWRLAYVGRVEHFRTRHSGRIRIRHVGFHVQQVAPALGALLHRRVTHLATLGARFVQHQVRRPETHFRLHFRRMNAACIPARGEATQPALPRPARLHFRRAHAARIPARGPTAPAPARPHAPSATPVEPRRAPTHLAARGAPCTARPRAPRGATRPRPRATRAVPPAFAC